MTVSLESSSSCRRNLLILATSFSRYLSRSITRDILNLPVARAETADIQRERFYIDYHKADVRYDADEKGGEIRA